MFSQQAFAVGLDRFEQHRGWRPTVTPVEEARQRAKALQQLVDPETAKLTRSLSPEETRWIGNERALDRMDFQYTLLRYSKILDVTGQLVFCIPNIAQTILLDICAEHEDKQLPIWLQILKARQEGISTLCEEFVGWRVRARPRTNALVASADPGKSRKMSEMIERTWKNTPWFLMPEVTEYNVGEYVKFGRQDSSLSIEWLNQTSGLGRGTTILIAHLSEVSDCKNPKDIIEASLKWAMHPSPWMWRVDESTANGMDGVGRWWYDQWEFAKKYWTQGMSERRPVFLPWYVASDMYPNETWLRQHPIPQGWTPAELTRRHAARAGEYVSKNDLLRRYLGAGWRMSPEQQWWWEFERHQAQQQKTLNKFYQEVPADDIEAFQHRHDSIFDAETISVYRENREHPKGVFGLIGNDRDIPLRLQPDAREIDTERAPLPIKTEAGLRYELVPLRRRPYELDDPEGKIYIYDWPQPEQRYGVGVDTGYGIGQDRSAIEVMRMATIDTHAKQVCEFASAECSASDLTPFAYAIGQMYRVKVNDDIVLPKMVVECNSNGETTQIALRKLGWPGARMHQWVRYDRKRIDQSKASRMGAFTTSWSRAMVLEYLIKAVRDYFIEIDSPWLITEFAQLAKDPLKQKVEAVTGGHDDRIMALGWVFLSLHILDPNPVIPAFGRKRVLPPEEVPKYEEYSLGWQERDLPLDSDVRSMVFLGGQRGEDDEYFYHVQ